MSYYSKCINASSVILVCKNTCDLLVGDSLTSLIKGLWNNCDDNCVGDNDSDNVDGGDGVDMDTISCISDRGDCLDDDGDSGDCGDCYGCGGVALHDDSGNCCGSADVVGDGPWVGCIAKGKIMRIDISNHCFYLLMKIINTSIFGNF